MQYKEMRERVLERIRPSKQEQTSMTAAVAVLVEELRSALAYKKISAEVLVGGSTAKGTGLKNGQDVDVFIRFKKGTDISDKLEEAIKLLPDAYERVHGSRDYFHLHRGKIMFELIPVLYITSPKKAMNVTDMSPLHVAYAKKRLSSRMKDDVRLAKQFCKAHLVYGAESYINGFSGHVLELLTIRYGSFQKFLRAASSWNEPVVIDLETHHKDPLKKLNASKIFSPLVIVDPVQPDRNAAAALSQKSYEQFRTAAKKFTKKPSLSAFTIKKITKESLKKKYEKTGSVVVLEMTSLEGTPDVSGTKCLKTFEYLHKQTEGFTTLNTGFYYDHDKRYALAFIHVAEKQLPITYERQGPPTNAKKGVLSFKQKHKNATERNNRLYVQLKREHRTLRAQILAHKKDTPVISRVVRVSL